MGTDDERCEQEHPNPKACSLPEPTASTEPRLPSELRWKFCNLQRLAMT